MSLFRGLLKLSNGMSRITYRLEPYITKLEVTDFTSLHRCYVTSINREYLSGFSNQVSIDMRSLYGPYGQKS